MICSNATPKKVERKWPMEMAGGKSYYKEIIYCNTRKEECNDLCPNYLFYDMKRKYVYRGYGYEVSMKITEKTDINNKYIRL